MDEISCEVCMDLIPLVRDSAASPDSCRLVEEHTASCPSCRALLKEAPPVPQTPPPVLGQVRRRLRALLLTALFLGLFFGIDYIHLASLEGELQIPGGLGAVFLLPLVGAASYAAFRWKALWQTPLMLLAVHALTFLVLLMQEGMEANWFAFLLTAAIAILLSEAGIMIVGLFHFGFKKEKKDDKT